MPAVSPQQFAAQLLASAAEVASGARGVLGKGALNVKTEAQRNVQQSAPVHNAHAAYAIDYDVDGLAAEIGYNKDKPGGPIGNLLEYGGKGDRSPAHRDLGRALDAEAPRFEDALRAMALKLL